MKASYRGVLAAVWQLSLLLLQHTHAALKPKQRLLKNGKRSSPSPGKGANIFAGGYPTKAPAASPPTGKRVPVDPTTYPTPYHESKGGKRGGMGGKRGSNSGDTTSMGSKGKGKGVVHKKQKPTPGPMTMNMEAEPSGSTHGMSKGKGKGKGGGSTPSTPAPTPPPNPSGPVTTSPTKSPLPFGCQSLVARRLGMQVSDVITQNPPECCMRVGPTTVYVTHAQSDPTTETGFEPFWDEVFLRIADLSSRVGACFVMTGYDQNVTPSRGLSDILVDVNAAASMISDVPAMMSTDPTDSVALINTIRAISLNPDLPSIGVFNVGYPNIIIEAIVTGLNRLPYVGVLRDSDFGLLAGQATTQLLNGVAATPLCFNARPDVDFVGVRCATFYDEVADADITPEAGVTCSKDTTVDTFVSQISSANANAILSHVDCCANVVSAVERLRNQGSSIVVGCTDEDTSGGRANFTTTQPIDLQGYQASSWVNLPLQIAEDGMMGRGEQFFPSLQSVVNAGIFNIIN